ncbi:type IV pilus biogenesis [Moraxella macacae 0408225]|uniref:Type IV pilus biogenesis n=1 Tax=Moraxella macacae 0408225 TaxID=1230338 RepID=L2F9J0_9GAMM|nr:type 4a pilus biogenesis protein PilO [Moraxella macacae]ELA09441.1 type IV pilus biogenesis [Moraxella macacae 0408225]
MVKLTKPTKKPLFAKKAKVAKEKAPKKQFDFKEFADSFKSLDQNNYGSWPLPVKITTLLFIIGLVAVLTWALPISKKREEISSAEAEQQTLLEQYREKESKARHLQAYKDQITQMENDFKELLNQLPKETRISDLVDGISVVGLGSNIKFQDIKVEPEVSQEFFIEQPIRIAALGNYHEFGAFVSGLAQLPRIITLHDFEVTNSKPSLDETPQTNLVLNTKTYRSKEIVEEKTEETTDEKK